MSPTVKNGVGCALVIALLCIAGSALWYVKTYSRTAEPTSFRSFSVGGSGKASAIPDVARFTASVVTEGDTNLGASQSKNTDKVNSVIAFIKQQGVEPKDVKTQQYSVVPRYQYFTCLAPVVNAENQSTPQPCPPRAIVGYTVSQTVAITVRAKNFASIGVLLSGVVKNGANSVSQLSFEVDDLTAVQNEARAQAIEKAKAKAQSMAQAGGFKLGRLLSIDEGSSPAPYYGGQYFGLAATASEEAKSAPTVESGSQDVTVDVTLKYEIE